MPSYRFCRSDDIPLLIDAYNSCYRTSFPELAHWDIPRFRTLAKEIDLCTSSCMVTMEEQRPVGVMLATKRESEMLVLAIGVQPKHRRQEHARHMLRSLSSKLAILGPPRMTAELPATGKRARSFFEACDWSVDCEFMDFVRQDRASESPFVSPLIQPLRLDDLKSTTAWEHVSEDSARCWDRSRQTLQNRSEEIRGWGIPSFDGWAAWLFHDQNPQTGERRILDLGAADPERGDAMQALLIRYFCEQEAPDAIRFPGVRVGDHVQRLLFDVGFQAENHTIRYVATPRPA